MVKIVIAVVLVFVTAGAWLYLDCLNKHELVSTERVHHDVDQVRLEASKRADAKAAFEYQLKSTLSSCQAAAEKGKSDYMVLIQKMAPSKRGKVIIPQEVMDNSETIATAAKADCQQIHDARLKNGL